MSKKAIHWSGVFPAVSTQFRSDYSLDLDATHAVMKNLVKDGVSGLVVCGSVGENTSLSTDEKLQIIEVAKDAAGGKIPVIAGVAEFTILTLGIGGLLLGILGTIGGPLTLFKGLDEMQQLAFSQTLTAADFLLIALVKLAALVLASASGFRGGRIFPAVFVGVALGLMLHAHVDAVPAAITVSCAILGMVLVVTRDGWLSLFMAAVVVPDTTLLPLLCMVMLPAWLLLAGRPLMIAKRHTD